MVEDRGDGQGLAFTSNGRTTDKAADRVAEKASWKRLLQRQLGSARGLIQNQGDRALGRRVFVFSFLLF